MLKTGLSLLPSNDYELVLTESALPKDLTLELTLDTFHSESEHPNWYTEAINQHLRTGGSFIGHLVSWPVFGQWQKEREQEYFELVRSQVTRLGIQDLTIHYGSLASDRNTLLPPVPLPHTQYTKTSLKNQMRRLQEAVNCKVGVEILALAVSKEDVLWQLDTIAEVSEQADTYVHLDFHNLFCQSVNFGADFGELLSRLPLGRIRHAHISGGSQSLHGKNPVPFRRDTHDDHVPEELWSLLEHWLGSLTNLSTITFERIAGSFDDSPLTRTSVVRELLRLNDLVIRQNKAEYNRTNRHLTDRNLRDFANKRETNPADIQLLNPIAAEVLIELIRNQDVHKLAKLYSAQNSNTAAIDLRAVDAARLILEKWTI